MKRILLIKADGQVTELPTLPTSTQMQSIVGGWIEHVKVVDRVEDGKIIYTSMYVNEEGLIHELPRNEKATEIYQRNIRIQFPNSKNPFEEANERFKKESIAKGFTVIDTADKDYSSDPFISGDAIFFEGYTIDEVDTKIMFETLVALTCLLEQSDGTTKDGVVAAARELIEELKK